MCGGARGARGASSHLEYLEAVARAAAVRRIGQEQVVLGELDELIVARLCAVHVHGMLELANEARARLAARRRLVVVGVRVRVSVSVVADGGRGRDGQRAVLGLVLGRRRLDDQLLLLLLVIVDEQVALAVMIVVVMVVVMVVVVVVLMMLLLLVLHLAALVDARELVERGGHAAAAGARQVADGREALARNAKAASASTSGKQLAEVDIARLTSERELTRVDVHVVVVVVVD